MLEVSENSYKAYRYSIKSGKSTKKSKIPLLIAAEGPITYFEVLYMYYNIDDSQRRASI